MTKLRIPHVGEVVQTSGQTGKFWVATVAHSGRTVELRRLNDEHSTMASIPWSDIEFVEEPGAGNGQTYSTAKLRELALHYYAGFLSRSRLDDLQALADDAHDTATMLVAYECLIAILKGRGEWPAGTGVVDSTGRQAD